MKCICHILKFLMPLLFSTCLLNCAAHYYPLDFDKLLVKSTPSDNKGITLSVITEPQLKMSNKRYYLEAKDENVEICAIVIENNSNDSFYFRVNNLIFLDIDQNEIAKCFPGSVYNKIKKPETPYLIWSGLLVFINGAPIPVGLIIGISNVASAKRNNKTYLGDLDRHIITRKTIKPGDKYCCIALLNYDMNNKAYNASYTINLLDDQNNLISQCKVIR